MRELKMGNLSFYKAHNTAVEEMSATGERSMRKNRNAVFKELPELSRKPRKQLSVEELEKRKLKVTLSVISVNHNSVFITHFVRHNIMLCPLSFRLSVWPCVWPQCHLHFLWAG